MPLQIRRGTEAERQAMTVPLAVGEPLFVTDTGSIYVGNGTSPGGIQVTGLTIEDSVDAVAAALVAGVNQNVTFVYGTAQDQANRIDCRLDLSTVEGTIDADGFKGPLLADDSGVIVNSTNRNITANEISATDISADNITISGTLISSAVISDFKGSVFGDDSSILVNALDSSINLSGTIKANVVPAFNDVIELGSVGTRFRSLYLSDAGLFIDDARIQSNFSGAIELPEGSTVGGQPIGSIGGNITGDINANIISDDSGVIVNVATRDIIASSITGDLRGSVFSDNSTLLVDGITGDISNGFIKIAQNTIIDETNFDIFIGRADHPNTLKFRDEQGTYMIDSRSLAGPLFSVSKIGFSSYKNSITNPGTPVAGDSIGSIIGKIYEPLSDSLVTVGGFVLSTDNNETISNDTVKGKMLILANGGTGSSPVIKFCSFDSSGRFAVNQLDAQATLDVNGFAKLAILSVAPSSPANGMIAIADGDNVAGWDPLGVPGKQQAVVYLGGGWRQIAVEP